jgi:anti-sigma B factor antagonist
MSTSSDTHSPALGASLRPRGPVQFEIVQEDLPDETILRANGEVDVMTAPRLSAQIETILRTRPGNVTVDLTGATFLDSAGLHVLLNAARRLTRRSRGLRVICGRGPVRHVIELARLVETLGVGDPDTPPT